MPTRDNVELEIKFDVEPGTPAPDLTQVDAIASVSEPQTEDLSATYFDTNSLDLAGNRITLRRRTGGHDAGWHLKRPLAGDGRRETQADLGDSPDESTVPESLASQIVVHVRGRRLVPVAVIDTQREVTVAYDDSGDELGELARDTVTASSLLPGGTSQTWSEWEFELRPDHTDAAGRAVLADVGSVLTAAGARPASSSSKLARAIGSTPVVAQRSLGDHPTALELVLMSLRRHRDLLVDHDPRVRADEDDAVHQMRVAARRLRSVIRGFPGVLDGPRTDALAEELKVLGQVLGAARDAEVQLARHRELLADEEQRPLLTRSLVEDVSHAHDRAVERVHAALDSDRYLALLDMLDAMIGDPEPGPHADDDAKDAVAQAVSHTRKAVKKATRRVDELPADSHEWEEAVHTVRKKAKALRYSAEAEKDLGVDAHRKTARRAAAIQDALGDFHDAVISRHRLTRLRRTGAADRDDTFVLGRLDAREQQMCAESIATWRALARKL
ncbi:CYTH and CHAD domain-containing protein [Gordonia jinhuaensis]|uniref:CHAD domain-containing protein n=1 Tax=Gordonia jinhuaensis TaxID=1517702 RepID=A0A916SVE0_9ACTN|nr:CYTH and CHAD domain-containing protein [Gordonia jinhuaensis]GGB18562.1 CHAD domain-containing protein [Gordonia jinhuaensis]